MENREEEKENTKMLREYDSQVPNRCRDVAKGDGEPYLRMLEERVANLTDEERAEMEALGAKLRKLMGMKDGD